LSGGSTGAAELAIAPDAAKRRSSVLFISTTPAVLSLACLVSFVVLSPGKASPLVQQAEVGAAGPCTCQSDIGKSLEECGFVPYDGYEGTIAKESDLWCKDGRLRCVVRELYASDRAARAAFANLLAGDRENSPKLHIARVAELGDASLIELSSPMAVGPDQVLQASWIVVWIGEQEVWSAYACNREGAIDAYDERKHK